MSSSHANMSSETPAENEGSERRARRDRAGGVTRSYQSEHKALDDLAAEAEAALAARRKARADARAMRLQEKLKEVESAHSEARAQEDERGAAEAQAALEAVRKQVEEREARNRELVAEEEQRTGTAKDVLEATESLVAKVLETESGQEAVQKLVEQVNLLKNQFKDSMLHANRLHAHKAKAAFEMDKLRDRLEDLDEEALELRAALREKNDEIQGVSYQASSRASRVAELEAENNTLREQLGAGGGNGVSAPVMDGPGAQQLQLEKEALQAEVARLKERLAGASATEAEDEPDAPNPDDPGLDPLASARIRRLEAQVKRLKTSLATAEENEDNSRKALRTCQRDVRKLKDDKMELEVSLESAQSQLKRLRDRKKRQDADTSLAP